MKTCLFCRNTRIFNIHNDYGNTSHTAKDDMLQFFGYQIESHLRPEDAICNLCMNIMDNVAKLKRRLLPLIFRSEPTHIEDCKPLNLGKKWDVFASMNFEEDNDPFLGCRTPTPTNLLQCKRVVPYESPVEMKIAEIERNRSLSRVSFSRSEPDSEIAKVFSDSRKRRRKRGHNWSRRKNGRYSRASVSTTKSRQSRRSNVRSRPLSRVSVMSSESYESFYPPNLESVTPHQKDNVMYVDDERIHSEQEVHMYFKEDSLHECNEDGCTFICENIDLMAQHKVLKHQHLSLFWCNYCNKKYTTNSDLEIHKRSHLDRYPCVICHKEFFYDRDLMTHWQEHVKKSVPCKYCGKRFINKKICSKHQETVHNRNMPSRIDYDKNIERSFNKSKSFEVRILVQSRKPQEA